MQTKSTYQSAPIQPSCKYLFTALAVIVMIGGLTASGLLFSQLGYSSLAIGGGGLLLGFCLLPATKCSSSLISAQEQVRCLGNSDLHLYITYLATIYPQIAISSHPDIVTSLKPKTELEYPLKGYLEKALDQNMQANLPIYLLVNHNHYTLIYIDREKRTVEYYDSKAEYGNYAEIRNTLIEIAQMLSDKEPYTFIPKITKSIQPDTYQCGVWVLYFLEQRLQNPEIDFNALDFQEAQQIIKEYRINVIMKINDMRRRREEISNKELEAYDEFHGQDAGYEKYEQDLKKISYIERWRQILANDALEPLLLPEKNQ